MARRRPSLRRLDLLVIGARPDRIADQTEIPAAAPGSLTAEQQQRLYILNYRRQFGAGLDPEEELERIRLIDWRER
jgi:hypothetical protein